MSNPGLLAVWTDVEAASQAEFHQWYDREHLQERVDVPGFRNARRYRAQGSPEFFAAYDTESVDALTSPAYQKALANQTDWSKRVFTGFRNTVRVVGEVVGAASTVGSGYGGWVLALRCAPRTGKVANARSALSGDLTKRLVATPGIVRAVAVVGQVSGLQVFGSGASDPADPTRGVLVVEGSDPAALTALNQSLLSDLALDGMSLGSPESRNVYTLQFAVTR